MKRTNVSITNKITALILDKNKGVKVRLIIIYIYIVDNYNNKLFIILVSNSIYIIFFYLILFSHEITK